MDSKEKDFKGKDVKGRDGKDFKGGKDPRKDKFTKLKAKGCKPNDVNWYVVNPQLMGDAGNFSFGNPAGVPLTVGPNAGDALSIPGIGVLLLAPAIGVTNDYASAANIAYVNQYAFIRHANSGSRNYEFADLGISQLAVGQIFAYIQSLVRIYGVGYTYFRKNRYFGARLLEALGCNSADIINNLATLRYGINVLIEKCKYIAVPKDQTIFDRWQFVEQGLFVDKPDISKAQLYVMDFDGYWKWSATTNSNGSSLIYMPLGERSALRRTVTDLLDFGTELIDAVTSDEDCGTIYGDILKAYGSENLKQLVPLPTDYKVTPLFSEEVLLQIQNANLVGKVVSATNGMDVTQSQAKNGAIVFAPPVSAIGGSLENARFYPLISSPNEMPTPAEVIVSTRLAATVDVGQNANKVGSCGSEIAQEFLIFTLDKTFNMEGTIVFSQQTSPMQSAELVKKISMLDKFYYHPGVHIVYDAGGSATTMYYGSVKDLDNYTVMTPIDLEKLHDCAIVSELTVRIGNVSKY